MNKRAGSLETTLLKGSCCFPLQLRISGEAAIMAIENAIVAIVIHTLTYTHTLIYSTNPIFVNKTLDKVRRLVYAGRLGVV